MLTYEESNIAYIVKDCTYSQDDAEIIKELFNDSRVVIIKNKNPVEPETLVDFYKKIGNVAAQNKKVIGSGVGGYGELVRVRKDGLFTGKEDGELEWHCAGMQRTETEDIVAMYMHQTSDDGGNTYFSDSQSAFEDLDEDMKNLCRDIQSKTFTYKLTNGLEKMHYKEIFSDLQTMLEFRNVDGTPAFETQVPRKPLVTKHPLNGKEGLYFPWVVIRGFTKLPQEKQKELYNFLKEHTLKEKYVYVHKWDLYDICISDQHHSLHKRDAYTGERELWRAGIWIKSYNKNFEEWSCESLISEPADD